MHKTVAERGGKVVPDCTMGPAWPAKRRGPLCTGRIAKLLIGQNHGFIRVADSPDVFFHRSDLDDGTRFNDFAVGDVVTFELLEDAVSGARASRVKHCRRQR
ncbi:MAG TPA: cold shock domain-containing protein [Vicinamibacterales bacterium]